MSKSLVAYFSRADDNWYGGSIQKLDVGNTEVVAKTISDSTNSLLFKINPVKTYPTDYYKCCEVAKEEHNKNIDIPLKEYLPDISSYDIIYLGYPIWWGTYPMAVKNFLKHYDFSGKIIYPFITQEGSGEGNSISDLKSDTKAIVKEPLVIMGSMAKSSKIVVEEWLNEK
jgi:flavodoxin